MKLGEVYIIQKDNPYHEWRVREFISRSGVKVVREEWGERTLRKYRYSGILDAREVLWLKVGKMTPDIKKVLEDVKLRKRLLVIEVERYAERKWATGLRVEGVLPKSLPPYKTWKEKEEECLKMLGSFRMEFENAETRKRLIGLMIRDPESWNDIKLGAEISRSSGDKVTIAYLQDMFPSIDFYRVDDWVLGVLEGRLKGKSIKVAEYFIKEKGYAEVWLMNRIRDKVLDISLVYDAYRNGIIYGDSSKTSILERSKVVGWDGGGKLAEMKPADLRWCLRAMEVLPYKYFVTVQESLYTGDKIVSRDWELYCYIEELRQLRGRFEDGGNGRE